MTIWVVSWKRASLDRTRRTVAEAVDLHQTGIAFEGMQWGNKYALPTDVDAHLQIVRDAGIKPYLTLWVGPLDEPERITARRAWTAGEGLWSGIILDPESEWKQAVRANAELAFRNHSLFFEELRKLTNFVAYAPYGIPHLHEPIYRYNWWNNAADLCMPQIYFYKGTQTAQGILGRAKRSFETVSQNWDRAPIPMVPIVNCWGRNAQAPRLADYARIAFETYGAMSWWRIHPDMNDAVKNVMRSIPREVINVPPINPPVDPLPPVPINNPWIEPWYQPGIVPTVYPVSKSSSGSGLLLAGGVAIMAVATAVGVALQVKKRGKMPVLDVLRDYKNKVDVE